MAMVELGPDRDRSPRRSAAPRLRPPRTTAGAIDRRVHGHVRARPGAVRGPARVAARAERRGLDLCDQRRLLAPEHFERIIGGDRWATTPLSRSRAPSERLGFYRNFERALDWRRAQAELIALCDQDDRWHPDKLATLRCALGDATLVYSDQRLVEAERPGAARHAVARAAQQPRRSGLDAGGQHHHRRRDAVHASADRASRCHFPDTPGFQFHDHWLAVTALAAGEVAYVDRPLYDYVQHPGAVFGDVTALASAGQRAPDAATAPGPRALAGGLLLRLPGARGSRRRSLLARCGGRLSPASAARWSDSSPATELPGGTRVAGARALRVLAGRTETLGSELELAQGIAWKQVARLRAPPAVAAVRRAARRREHPAPAGSFSAASGCAAGGAGLSRAGDRWTH